MSMKAILEFNLPDDEDYYYNAKNANKYNSALYDIKNFIRSKMKYTELTEGEYKLLEEVRELIPTLDEE